MASKINILIDQGSTFNTEITVLDESDNLIDFTNYTANSQIRKSYSSSLYYSFNVSGSNSGVLTLSMNAATTNTIPAGRYVYDVEVETSGVRSRLVEGIVVVTPQVTR